MKKEQLDELYHLLRCASNEGKNELQAFLIQSLILGLSRHLLAGGDYLSLIQFSAFYGEQFLLEPTYEAILGTGWQPKRIVEFGCGLGWLGRGLAAKFGLLPTLFSDKRPWTMIDVVADLETEDGRAEVLRQLRPDDLIVASDFYHCTRNPDEIVFEFRRWPMAVLEYCPANTEYRRSYETQLSRYGGSFINPVRYENMFPGRLVDIVNFEPYILLLVGKER